MLVRSSDHHESKSIYISPFKDSHSHPFSDIDTEFNESFLHQKIMQMLTLWVKFSLNIYRVISSFKAGDMRQLPDIHVGVYKYTQGGDKDEPING